MGARIHTTNIDQFIIQKLVINAHKPSHEMLPDKARKNNPLWANILRFLKVKDMFKVQQLSVGFWNLVNPSSELCQVNYNVWFGVQTKKSISSYGSLMFLF